jgi:hypothetical protein
MGPKLTRSLAVVVGVVAVFGSVRLPAAQNFPADPLAVRMPDDATAADVQLVVTMAVRLGVPLGFEAVGALAERVSMPFRPGPDGAKPKPLVSVRPRPLDVRGVPLRHALDAVVAKDRRYAWQLIDGVVVVRPVAAWGDPSHPWVPLMEKLNAMVRARGRSHWILEPASSLVLLDRGRAVEVTEPRLRVVDEAGEQTLPLRGR